MLSREIIESGLYAGRYRVAGFFPNRIRPSHAQDGAVGLVA